MIEYFFVHGSNKFEPNNTEYFFDSDSEKFYKTEEDKIKVDKIKNGCSLADLLIHLISLFIMLYSNYFYFPLNPFISTPLFLAVFFSMSIVISYFKRIKSNLKFIIEKIRTLTIFKPRVFFHDESLYDGLITCSVVFAISFFFGILQKILPEYNIKKLFSYAQFSYLLFIVTKFAVIVYKMVAGSKKQSKQQEQQEYKTSSEQQQQQQYKTSSEQQQQQQYKTSSEQQQQQQYETSSEEQKQQQYETSKKNQ